MCAALVRLEVQVKQIFLLFFFDFLFFAVLFDRVYVQTQLQTNDFICKTYTLYNHFVSQSISHIISHHATSYQSSFTIHGKITSLERVINFVTIDLYLQ